MLEFNVSQSARLPVILKNSSAQPIAGATYNGVSISILKNDGSQLEVVASSTNWSEITGAAYTNQGYYNYILTSTLMDVTGVFQYAVVYTGSVPYFGVVKCTDGDSGAIFNRLGQPVSGTISNDIQNVPAAASSGGFTANDRAMLSATWHTATNLPSDVASNSATLSYVTQSFWTGDRQNLQAIKTKTDNLPTDPASNAIVTSSINSAINTIDNNTNSGFTTIQGAGWSSNTATLKLIGDRVLSTYTGGATQAYLSYAFTTITGNGFVSGSDDLHALSVAIQGITPGSGGGGFSTTDRAMLESAYSQTLPLPTDPASNSYISGVVSESRKQIRGEYPYGYSSGGNTGGLSIYSLVTASQAVYTRVITYIPANLVASQADVQTYAVSGVNLIAGATWLSGTSTLGGIYAALTASNFTAQDRAYISQTFSSQSVLYAQELTTNSNVLLVKAKTDLLPNDVVSTAHIDPQLAQILSASAVSGGFSQADRQNIIDVKAKTDNLPAQPADAAVTFGTSDRNVLNQVYSKTNNLPADPVSTTYVTLVSQSLATAILNSQTSTSGAISASLSRTLSGTNHVLAVLGTPAGASVSADIAAVGITAGNAYTSAQAADTHAQQATSQATAAVAGTANILSTLGTPMSGTVSADISATYHAALSVSATLSGSGVSADLGPILKVLGKPVKTIAEDIKQTAAIAASKK